MQEVIPIVAITSTFGAAVLIIYIIRSSLHRERMAMIEKGYDATLLKPAANRDTGKYNSLKWGMVAIGVGVGLLLGNILESYVGMSDDVAYFSMIFLCGGAGLVLYYLIVSRQKGTEQ